MSAFFRPTRASVSSKRISSRRRGPIGAKICQILLRGRLDDILEPDRHHVPLNEDFSNLNEALRRYTDPSVRRVVAEEARAHVAASHTYAHRLRQIEDVRNGSGGSAHSAHVVGAEIASNSVPVIVAAGYALLFLRRGTVAR
jgi:hypothetical protein